MENTPDLILIKALDDIRYHFDFLFRRGFRIASVLLIDSDRRDWQIVLTAGTFLVKIHGHGERAGLALSSLELCNEVGFFELHDLLDLIEREGNPSDIADTPPQDEMQGIMKLAQSLEKHVDNIWAFVGRIHLAVSIKKTGQSLEQLSGFF